MAIMVKDPVPQAVQPFGWNNVNQLAQIASQLIPLPDADFQAFGAAGSTPAADALGISQAIAATGLPPVSAAVQSLPQAFVQAAGGPVANTALASLLGVGLGGLINGTGPLPGGLGVAARQIFGTNGVPVPAQYPTVRVILELHPSFRKALQGTGTATATRLLGIKPRLLGEFRAAMMDLAAIRAEDDFRASMLTLLRELINHVSSGIGGTPFAPPVLPVAPPVVTPVAPMTFPSFSPVAPTSPGSGPVQAFPVSPTPSAAQGQSSLPPALFDALVTGLKPTVGASVIGSTTPGQPMAAIPYASLRPTTIVGSTVQGQPMAAIPFVRGGGVTPVTVTPVGAPRPSGSATPVYVTPIGQSSSVPHFVGASPTSGLGRQRRWRA